MGKTLIIAEAGINVDMISQTPPNGQHSSLSFTVDGEEFGGILRVCAEMREHNPELKISVKNTTKTDKNRQVEHAYEPYEH